MLQLNGVTKSYKAGGQLFKAVDNADFDVQRGDFLSVLGHSGSGKTTLLNLAGGLTRPDTGTVTIDGTDIWGLKDTELSHLRNKKINFVFQFASLIPTLTSLENVMLPTAFGKFGKGVGEKASALLEMVGLKEKLHVYPSQLSGGQQRRVAIARAFINDPEYLLADEPTGDLDEETESEIFSLFERMNKENNISFVIVTHSKELAGKTKRTVRMEHGKIIG